ncbi:MAG: AAA family ATPase [OCS116 cluster bacterium]|nr:AAA family ATPase [OCS116 cluster bacterium]
MVMGCAGAGKSALARRIAEITSLRLIHMDPFYYKPNWVVREAEEVKTLALKAIEVDGWVFDGNHSETHEIRAEKSEIIIWVDIPRWRCFYNVFLRFRKFRGQTRPDMADGCEERVTWGFIKFIWSFNQRSWKIVKLLEDNKHKKQVYRFKNYAEIDAFVEKMRQTYG